MRGRSTPFAWLSGLLLGLAAVLLSVAPAAGAVADWPTPNWVLLVALFWVLRRPTAAPALVLFAVGLIADLLRGGAVGAELFALLLVAERLRALSAVAPAASIYEEWARAAAAVLAFEAAIWALLAAAGAGGPHILDQAVRAALTIAVFPLVAEALGRVFSAPRDARRLDAYGL